MSEYASNEVRVHDAEGSPMGLLGQVMFYVDYYNMAVDREVRLGEIYTDGRFTPPNLKAVINEKEKLENAIITPAGLQRIAMAKIPVVSP